LPDHAEGNPVTKTSPDGSVAPEPDKGSRRSRRQRFAADQSAPQVGRDLARGALADPRWPVDSQTREDTIVVVNELVTASCVAGATNVELDVEVHRRHVTVFVRDDRPREGRGSLEETSARSMLLDAITTSRSVYHDWDCTVTVAQIRRNDTPGGRHLSVVR
jgi:hypothetical protein